MNQNRNQNQNQNLSPNDRWACEPGGGHLAGLRGTAGRTSRPPLPHWLVALVAVALLGGLCAAPARAGVDWQRWSIAKRRAERSSRLILVLYEPRVLSSMWPKGPAFMRPEVDKILAREFTGVWLKPGTAADDARAKKLGITEGHTMILDLDGSRLRDYPNIGDGSEFLAKLRALLVAVGERPDDRTAAKLARDLGKAKQDLKRGRLRTAIGKLQRVAQAKYRCTPVTTARQELKRLDGRAGRAVDRALAAAGAQRFTSALIELDRLSRTFGGLSAAKRAKSEARALRRSRTYKAWKKTAKERAAPLWDKVRAANEAEPVDFDALFAALVALDALDAPGDGPKIARILREHRKNPEAAAGRDRVLERARCEAWLAEAQEAEAAGDAALARSMYEAIVKTYPKGRFAARAQQALGPPPDQAAPPDGAPDSTPDGAPADDPAPVRPPADPGATPAEPPAKPSAPEPKPGAPPAAPSGAPGGPGGMQGLAAGAPSTSFARHTPEVRR